MSSRCRVGFPSPNEEARRGAAAELEEGLLNSLLGAIDSESETREIRYLAISC